MIRYTFPADGEYEIRVRLARDLNLAVPVYAEPQHLEVSLDGERLQLFTLPGVAATPRPAAQRDDDDSRRSAGPSAAGAEWSRRRSQRPRRRLASRFRRSTRRPVRD